MDKCVKCAFAKRDHHNRFTGMCSGYGNCSFEPFEGIIEKTPIEKMQDKLNGAVMSKFLTVEECKAYRSAISDCIQIMIEE